MIRTKEIMSHQNTVVEFCEPLPFAGIFSDYGTGKSLIALLLTQLKKYRKVLIVSTKLSVDSTWCDEIRIHTDFRFCILQGTAKQKVTMLQFALDKVSNPNRYEYVHEGEKPLLFLINYEGVKSIYRELMEAQFDAVFADESTKIKTFDTERTLALNEVRTNIPNRYIMTGFPITENLAELYAQIKFLDLGATFGNNYYAFLNKYFVRIGPRWVVKKKAIQQILSAIAPFCIRITNKTLKLPPAVYKPIELELTDQQREILLKFNDTFKLELGKVKIDTKYIFTLLSKSLEVCDGFVQKIEKEIDPETGKSTGKILSSELEIVDTNKDEALVETLEEIDVLRNKVVIWCAFTFSVKKIQHILTKLKIPVLALTGETKNANKMVQMFQKSREYNVIVCTQQKAAESITLTSARYNIYYSRMWSNDKRLNSEARTRRKGSENHESIIYIDLITKNSVEKKVYECLRRKKSLIDELKTAFLEMRG